MKNHPDKPGIWEWFDEIGTKRLVLICDVAISLQQRFPSEPPYLRVYFAGGYYNVNDEHDPENPQYDELCKAEWPDRWGNYVGPVDSVPEEQLYLGPTPEERDKILKQHEGN